MHSDQVIPLFPLTIDDDIGKRARTKIILTFAP